jgi:S-adenosylmethionine decarboxylase
MILQPVYFRMGNLCLHVKKKNLPELNMIRHFLLILSVTLENIILKANATPLDLVEHAFEPQGKTSCYILAESHLAIHTYPEHAYVSLDLFTCGTSTDPERSVQYIIDLFKPENAVIQYVKRGL